MEDFETTRLQQILRLTQSVLTAPTNLPTKAKKTIKPNKEALSWTPNASKHMIDSESRNSQDEMRLA